MNDITKIFHRVNLVNKIKNINHKTSPKILVLFIIFFAIPLGYFFVFAQRGLAQDYSLELELEGRKLTMALKDSAGNSVQKTAKFYFKITDLNGNPAMEEQTKEPIEVNLPISGYLVDEVQNYIFILIVKIDNRDTQIAIVNNPFNLIFPFNMTQTSCSFESATPCLVNKWIIEAEMDRYRYKINFHNLKSEDKGPQINFIFKPDTIIPQSEKAVVISAEIKDIAGISEVNPPKLVLPAQNGIPEKEILLYNDGQHSDQKNDDFIFANTLDINNFPLGDYLVYITAQDGFGNETKESFKFVVKRDEDLCREAIPGHNKLQVDRINIVFVGFQQPDIASFTERVKTNIDFENTNRSTGKRGGIFSFEPFKSNKNAFNFWYVDYIKLLPSDLQKPNKCWEKSGECIEEVKKLSLVCGFSLKSVISFVDVNQGQVGGYAIEGLNVIFPFEITTTAGLALPTTPLTTLHEFGHSFGWLGDDYVLKGKIADLKILSGNGYLYGYIWNKAGKNIFFGSKDECLNTNSNIWANRIETDCKSEPPECVLGNMTLSIIDDCLRRIDPDKKQCIYCFQGGGGFETNAWRPTYISLMQNMEIVKKAEDNYLSRAFGKVNEKFLCERIKEVAGKAGGICESEFNIK